MKDRYILATDTFNSKIFSICVFDRQKGLIVVSENIFCEKEFGQRINELSKHYSCSRIEEYEIREKSKNSIYTKVPSLEEAMVDYLNTEKGKHVVRDYIDEQDCIDYGLIEELLIFSRKYYKK